MAKEQIRAPQGMAGLSRFSGDEEGKLRIKPEHVIVLAVIVVLVVAFLHIYGNRIFGI